jgi:acetyltransferase-like isoleucine patch superfamily enzyme
VGISTASVGDISFGKNVRLFSDVRLAGKITIGDYSYVNYRSCLFASRQAPITIGKFCSLSVGMSIFASNDHFADHAATYPFKNIFGGSEDNGAPVVIGNDVWIGANTVILPGVTIGDGAIIGANSTVTAGTQVGAYEVWVGSPAKKISERFTPEVSNQLGALKWWNWPLEKIKKNKHLFSEALTSEALKNIL